MAAKSIPLSVRDHCDSNGHRTASGEPAGPCERCGTVAMADLLRVATDREHDDRRVICCGRCARTLR